MPRMTWSPAMKERLLAMLLQRQSISVDPVGSVIRRELAELPQQPGFDRPVLTAVRDSVRMDFFFTSRFNNSWHATSRTLRYAPRHDMQCPLQINPG